MPRPSIAAAPEAWSARWRVLVFAPVLAVATALLIVAALPHRIGDYYAESDFYGGYAAGARMIQRGALDAARYGVVGPVYEIVLALAGFVTRDLFVAGEAISILGAAGTLLIWTLLLRKRAGGVAALSASLLIAANPTFFRYGYSVTSDMIALCFASAAVFMMLDAGSARSAFLSGALTALAALTRYNLIALLPCGILCAIAANGGAARWRRVVVYLTGFLVPAAPWTTFSVVHGHVPGELLFHDVAYDVYASARGANWATYQTRLQGGFRSLLDVLTRDPAALLGREGSNLLSHGVEVVRELLGWPVALACAISAALAIVDRSWRSIGALLLIGAVLYLALVPAFYSNRYFLVLLPFAAALASLMARGALGRGPAMRVLVVCVLATALGLSVRSSLAEQKESLSTLPVEILEMAKPLHRLARPGDRVMAAKAHLAYEADVAFTPLPAAATLASLAYAARANGADYLYYSWLEANNHPSFWYLLDPAAGIPGLTRIAFTAHHPAALYRIGLGFGGEPRVLSDEIERRAAETRVIGSTPAEWRWRMQVSLAVADLEQGMPRAAFEHAAAVVAERPYDALAWRLYGESSARLGDRDRSMFAFERVLAIEPGNVTARIALGWMVLGEGDERRAAALWKPAAGATEDRKTLERMIVLFHARGDRGAEAAARRARTRLGAFPQSP